MRKVMRWRYYCEFCKKSGASGGHMSRHEKSCTLNPNRVCRMCKMMEREQQPIGRLLSLLPNPIHNEMGGFYVVDVESPLSDALPKLREATDNCPACIMAAIRQKGIPVPMVDGFNFTGECRAEWTRFNEAQNIGAGYR